MNEGKLIIHHNDDGTVRIGIQSQGIIICSTEITIDVDIATAYKVIAEIESSITKARKHE